ncbi:MAG TPA: ribosome recycling factor [Terriglobales bacterium]|nr:ribosome recycling factor [Terriglobales bacterium]
MAPPVMATLPALKETYVQLKTRMDKAVADFSNNLASTRTGRASVHMLDGVKVEAYGSEMALNQVAQVHAADAQMITVQPFDPSTIASIEKALRSPEFGFNPQNDGKIIRVPIPPLTEERRKEMVKHLHKVLEDHRTAVRNIRRDGNDAIKKALKDKKVSEDEEKKALDEIQKLTDEEIKKMEEMCKNKEKEVMQV